MAPPVAGAGMVREGVREGGPLPHCLRSSPYIFLEGVSLNRSDQDITS
jgi:hypothetical protein